MPELGTEGKSRRGALLRRWPNQSRRELTTAGPRTTVGGGGSGVMWFAAGLAATPDRECSVREGEVPRDSDRPSGAHQGDGAAFQRTGEDRGKAACGAWGCRVLRYGGHTARTGERTLENRRTAFHRWHRASQELGGKWVSNPGG